ncbi:MerR family transcriptional regulator [Streptomyces cinereoruber]|uniref:MerR family transcriptional regulator n=1 Tax=Streptomyces cinereoruber TaxID=67260 RepID=UPI0036937228
MDGKHMQIGEVAARTELSLRTIRHYEEAGLVVPSARSRGGFRLYTETDVARLMVIRRMKPLGFTLDQMRDLLDATDRLDADADADVDRLDAEDADDAEDAEDATNATDRLDADEREALLERVRTYRQAAAEQVEKLRVQLSRAEDFADTLSARLDRNAPATRV